MDKKNKKMMKNTPYFGTLLLNLTNNYFKINTQNHTQIREEETENV